MAQTSSGTAVWPDSTTVLSFLQCHEVDGCSLTCSRGEASFFVSSRAFMLLTTAIHLHVHRNERNRSLPSSLWPSGNASRRPRGPCEEWRAQKYSGGKVHRTHHGVMQPSLLNAQPLDKETRHSIGFVFYTYSAIDGLNYPSYFPYLCEPGSGNCCLFIAQRQNCLPALCRSG